MKNIILYMLILALLVMPLAGCGSPAPEAPKETEAPTTGLPNPVHEVDEAGLAAATGISLPAPQGAEDVRWSYIEQTGDVPISQMNFILDGAEAYLRAQPTAELEAGLSPASTITGPNRQMPKSAIATRRSIQTAKRAISPGSTSCPASSTISA